MDHNFFIFYLNIYNIMASLVTYDNDIQVQQENKSQERQVQQWKQQKPMDQRQVSQWGATTNTQKHAQSLEQKPMDQRQVQSWKLSQTTETQNDHEDDYMIKYLKYKKKYLQLKKLYNIN